MDTTNLRRDARTAAIALVCGLLLIGLGLTGVWGSQTGVVQLTGDQRWWLALPFTVSCVAMAFKRRAPVTALSVGFLALAADALLGGSIAILLPFFDLLYTAALVVPPPVRRALWGIAGVFVAIPVIDRLADTADLRVTVLIGLQQAAIFVCPLWWAMDVRRKTELATVAADRADAVERLSLASRQQAIRQERDSLARDLHDVVASHLSAIALHSGGALATPPNETKDRAALTQVRRSALESMEDMRTMITLLRAPDPDPVVDSAPDDDGAALLPRLTHLQPLLDQAETNGLSVALDDRLSVPRDGQLSAATELVGYRIVQEALTNAAKHAPGSKVTLQLLLGQGHVSIRLRNALPATALPGTTLPASPSQVSPAGANGPPGLGLGLISMKERAASIGGWVTAGADGDQWAVSAELPLAATGTTVVS
ncbi:sensor histidine kinase [Arthrobacter sp. Hz1]